MSKKEQKAKKIKQSKNKHAGGMWITGQAKKAAIALKKREQMIKDL